MLPALKAKVTLILDTEQPEEFRSLVNARSLLFAKVDRAVESSLSRLQHLDAIDPWLAGTEAGYGPVDPETLEWVDYIIDTSAESTAPATKAGCLLLLDSEAISSLANGPAGRRDRLGATVLAMRGRDSPIATFAAILAMPIRGRPLTQASSQASGVIGSRRIRSRLNRRAPGSACAQVNGSAERTLDLNSSSTHSWPQTATCGIGR